MNGVLVLVSFLLLLAGVVVGVIALKYRTLDHPPVPSWNPKHWRPFWMMKDWYTPRGFTLARVAVAFIILASAIELIRRMISE